MLSLNEQIFPRLGMGNVTLEKNNIHIKGFLSGTKKNLLFLRSQNTFLSSYAKVYYIISVPRSLNDKRVLPPSILVSREKRFSNLATWFGKRGVDSSYWFKEAEKVYYVKSISIGEILNKTANITTSELDENGKISDVNFEIDIPIEEDLYKRTDVKEVMVHSFAQFHIPSLVEAGIIKRLTISARRYLIGGNLKSKKILELTESGLTPPGEKTGLVVARTGQPYYGVVERFSDGMYSKERAEKLMIVTSEERDISADYFVETNASLFANRPREQTSKQLEFSYSKPVLQFLKTDIPVETDTDQIYSSEYIGRLKEFYAKKQISDPKNNYITNAVHSIDVNGLITNKVMFDLNFERLIKDKTKNGFLIDIIKKNTTINNLLTIQDMDKPKRFDVQSILRNFHIKKLIIYLNRVSKTHTSNMLGTKKNVPESEGTIVASIDNFMFEQDYSSENLEVINNDASNKRFSFNHSRYLGTSQAEYCYSMSLTIEDKMDEYFYSLFSTARQLIDSIEVFLQKIERDPRAKHQLKNKDKVSIFLKNTKTSPPDVGSLIDIYFLMLLLSGKEYTKSGLISTRKQVFRMANLQDGGTITGLYKFLNMSKDLVYDLQKVLGIKNREVVEESKKAPGQSQNSKLIYHSEKIAGKVKSLPVGKVLASYGAADLEPGFHEPESFLYKKDNTFAGTLLTKSEIQSTVNQLEKDNKLLLLENMIRMPEAASSKEVSKLQSLENVETENVFNISGLSVTKVTSQPDLIFGDIQEKIRKTESDKEVASSLSTQIKSSIESSLVQPDPKKILQSQALNRPKTGFNESRKEKVASNIMKALSSVRDLDPRTKSSSTPVDLNLNLSNIEKTVFSRRVGQVTIGLPSDSGEMIFEPLSMESLSRNREEQIVVKIQEPMHKTPKEDYELVNNVFTLSKTMLKNLLTQSR